MDRVSMCLEITFSFWLVITDHNCAIHLHEKSLYVFWDLLSFLPCNHTYHKSTDAHISALVCAGLNFHATFPLFLLFQGFNCTAHLHEQTSILSSNHTDHNCATHLHEHLHDYLSPYSQDSLYPCLHIFEEKQILSLVGRLGNIRLLIKFTNWYALRIFLFL